MISFSRIITPSILVYKITKKDSVVNLLKINNRQKLNDVKMAMNKI